LVQDETMGADEDKARNDDNNRTRKRQTMIGRKEHG
jgi:hypothetical protein